MKKIIYILLFILPLSLFSASMNKNGIVTKLSHNSVTKTINILTKLAEKRGSKKFTIIDHKKNALKRGNFIIGEAKLIIFSESNICLNLLKTDPAVGLDLPLKVLVYVAEDKKVYIKYRDPKFLKNIYNLGNTQIALKMSKILDECTTIAAK
ncbi:DUF302 domain-containing protein [Sulfurospirillum arcachonense]|uniref:DUF302 domain-containing protein n=1 Tax=Sulfurospirillum arcachonense TaxID=57666 RepID=UPI0004690F95|nr:DUF302 domain-containing protein [Sulfurospirillum arcachonense]